MGLNLEHARYRSQHWGASARSVGVSGTSQDLADIKTNHSLPNFNSLRPESRPADWSTGQEAEW